jgi:peptide chain release factor subunit 1
MNDIRTIKGRGTELISLYIPDGRIADAHQLLRDEYGKAGNIKSRITRQSVESAIKSCQEKLKSLKSGNYAVFCGETSDGWINEAIECPKPIKGIIYRCGNTFDLSILDEMLDKGPKYAIINMDLSEFFIGVLQGTSITTICKDESIVPNKHSKGGQSSRRFDKNRDLAIIAWYKKLAESANILLNLDITGVIISGPGMTKNEFVDREYLHHELRKKIIGVIDTGYTGEQGLRETIQNARDLLKDTELIKQRNIMEKFFKELSRDKVVYGKSEIINAIKNGSISTVLVSHDNPDIQELSKNFGSDYTVISDTFEEGKQLSMIFGGFAGILRYKR